MSTQFTAPSATESGILSVNGYTWAALGARPMRLDGLYGASAVERALADAPGTLGQLAAPYVRVAPRTITCGVVLVVDTPAAQFPALERLRRACSGLVELRLDAAQHTVMRAACSGFDVEPALGRPGLDDSVYVTLTFTLYDTARYRRDVLPYALVAGQTVPLLHGDAHSVARYVHFGPSSGAVTLTVLAPDGQTVSAMTFTTALTSDQTFVIDWGSGTMTREPGGSVPSDLVVSTGPWVKWVPDGALDAATTPDGAMRAHLSAGAGVLYLRDAWSF